MKQLTQEFLVSDPVDDAVRKAKITLKNLGELTAVVPNQYVVGTVAFGVQHTTLRISWHPEEMQTKLDGAVQHTRTGAKMLGTMLYLEATSEEGGESALRSAIDRFEEAYLHFDRPDFKPDRLGVLPITIIGVVIALGLLALLLGLRTNVFKPKPKPSPGEEQKAEGQSRLWRAGEEGSEAYAFTAVTGSQRFRVTLRA